MILLFSVALAHKPGISFAQFQGETLRLTFARTELEQVGRIEDLHAARILIAEATVDKARLRQGDAPCSLGEPSLREVEADGVELAMEVRCPGSGDWTFEAGYLAGLEPGHRVYVETEGQPVAMLDRSAPSTTFHPGEAQSVALRFLGLGMEHIWTGYDHLAFLAGLVLVARGLREMLLIVTGFTIAHSITLSLAGLEIFSLSPSIVEPAIAASIVYVGVENLWRPQPRRRMLTTFFLGLIHGFGFAGLLAELGVPAGSVVTALLAFNGGVEIGQAVIVSLTLPILLWLRRYAWWDTKAVPALSLAVGAAGLWWLVERVFLGG